jgi:hypothetical protein
LLLAVLVMSSCSSRPPPAPAVADRVARPATDDLPPVQPAADDWPWWCGPSGNNVAAPGEAPPIRWGQRENVVWEVPVAGRGHGSPCLWGDNLFLPTADEEAQAQYLLCYDRRTGRQRWQAEVHRAGFVRINPKNSHASATPACDGRLVFIPFAIQNALWITAFDFQGNRVWQRRLGDFQSMHGFAASPVLYRSLVIVTGDHLGRSFLAAVQRRTGELAWKIDRPSYRLGTYATPALARLAGRDQLLLHGPMKVFSYDPSTGRELWTCDGPSESSSSTMSFDAHLAFSSVGFPQRNMLCIRADGTGDVTATHVAWSKHGKMAYVPSLLVADGLLYMVVDEGGAACFEAATGKTVWTAKLAGQFSSSPVLAGGHVYALNEAGTCFVFKAGRQFELVARNDLGDGGFATPAICGGRIYLRSLHRLYCLGTITPRPPEKPPRRP